MIARSQRMLGKAVVFPFGLDQNGINIERTVEKKYGKPLHEWDRETFIAKCREEISGIGVGIIDIAKRMGMTADFAHTYRTDSDEYRAFSQAIFIRLFNQGLFYRGERPSFYCAAWDAAGGGGHRVRGALVEARVGPLLAEGRRVRHDRDDPARAPPRVPRRDRP